MIARAIREANTTTATTSLDEGEETLARARPTNSAAGLDRAVSRLSPRITHVIATTASAGRSSAAAIST